METDLLASKATIERQKTKAAKEWKRSITSIRVIEPMQIHEVINRTVASRYLLLTDNHVRNEIGAWLARAQRKYRVRLYAYAFMSNHYHLLAAARNEHAFADFVQYFQCNLARCLNKYRKRSGAFWARRYTAIATLDNASLADRVAYIHLNPVKAGMCKKPEQSPVLSSAAELLRGDKEAFYYYEVPKDGPKKGKRVRRKIRIKCYVLPYYKNISIEERRKRLRADMKKHRANEPPMRERPQPKQWWGRPRTRLERGKPRPLCYSVCKKTKAAYIERLIDTVDAYVKAAVQYAKGKLDRAMFPPYTFVPSRLPKRVYCGLGCG